MHDSKRSETDTLPPEHHRTGSRPPYALALANFLTSYSRCECNTRITSIVSGEGRVGDSQLKEDEMGFKVDELPIEVQQGDLVTRYREFGDMAIRYAEVPAGVDFAAVLKGPTR